MNVENKDSQTTEDKGSTVTHVIGRREANARPFVEALKKGRLNIGKFAMGAAIGLAIANIPIIKDSVVMLSKNASEMTAMAQTNIPATVENISWVDLPQSPFFQAGYLEDGTFEPEMLFERWHSAGIDVEEFPELIELGRFSAPTIMGTDDPMTVERMKEEAVLANEMMMQNWPQAATLLSNKQWLDQHQYTEIDEQTRRQIDDLILYLHEDMQMDEVSGPGNYIDVEGVEHAREIVEMAMRQTGLKSLTLSSPIARNPWHMGNAGNKLIEINDILRDKTGWDGAVLGLGGRVDWVLERPGEMREGTMNYLLKMEDGLSPLKITSGFGAAPHEFWHAFELVMGRKALVSYTGGTVLAQLDGVKGLYVWEGGIPEEVEEKSKVMRIRKHHDAVLTLIDGYEQISSSTPEWMALRELADKKHDKDNGYFLWAEEIMASAFTAQIYKWDVSSIGEPSMHEAKEHEPIFEAVFRAADSMELTKRPTPTLINVKHWAGMVEIFTPSTTITSEDLGGDIMEPSKQPRPR